MLNHYFNVEWAVRYGDREAILLTNIAYWVKTNHANGRNIFEGKAWTFNSRKAFTELFPYWSEKQIYRLLQSLMEQGAIMAANHNEDKRDRTLWYTLADDLYGACIAPNGTAHCTERDNALSQTGQCILYNNITDNKQQIINTKDNIPPIIPPRGESPRERKTGKTDFKGMADDFAATIPEDDWRELVIQWLDYKIAIKHPLRCQTSLATFLKTLRRDSGGDIAKAREFLETAMANGWIGYHKDARKSAYEQRKDYERAKAAESDRRWREYQAEREKRDREDAERREREQAEYERKVAEWRENERRRKAAEDAAAAERERQRLEDDLPF